MLALKTTTFSTGLAIFSMFFGAGNIVFPLVLGQIVKDGITLASFGLFLTAVLVPFFGLVAITLFKGNYVTFFNRLGKTPALVLIFILLAILGPFGAIPRCITLTYSTLEVYLPKTNLLAFSILSCVVIFFFSWKKTKIVDVIGYILSPLLLLLLCNIIVRGIFFSTYEPIGVSQISNPFLYGLKEGYNTMDLIAAFFFSSLVYERLKMQKHKSSQTLLIPTLKSGLIGFSILGTIYGGFGYIAARQSSRLEGISIEYLLGKIGSVVLGERGGFVVSLCVALTCLTTAIALSVVSAEFLQKQVSKKGITYEWSIAIILIISLGVSSLNFQGIMNFLAPFLQIIYPSILVLCFCNILYKLVKFKPIKAPVYLTFVIIIFFKYFT